MTMREIELITLRSSGPNVRRDSWAGPRRVVDANPSAVASALEQVNGDAVLLLDQSFDIPDTELLHRLLDGPADAWHAGLRLGLEGHPRLYNHVQPLWMLNTRIDTSIETTSWRLSLRAALIRSTVLEQLGGPDAVFDTLSGASLDLGLRWIRAGALLRHRHDLVPDGALPDAPPSDLDGLRLIRHHHGKKWAGWALQRALVTGNLTPAAAVRLLPHLLMSAATPAPDYQSPSIPSRSRERTVSVILPTIDRYPFLIPLLNQLAAQTTPPHQVLIVDQTPLDRRRHDLTDVEPNLPVMVFAQDEPGQSTARNTALRAATGEFVLFIDDDDEIGPELIGEFLARMTEGVDAVSGAVDDATAGPPPEGFRHRRANDNFPTNNTLLRRSALQRSGLFDPTFDRGPRADHDLGMRLHLAGGVLIYDPSVMVFHHHAPVGGLRTHGARRVTNASARRSILERNLPAVTQLYLGYRYFTAAQRREGKAITLMSTLSGEGRTMRRIARAAIQAVLMPDTIRHFRRSDIQAKQRWLDRPAIPSLDVTSV